MAIEITTSAEDDKIRILIEQIKTLNIMDLVELVKDCRQVFGVTDE